MWYQIYGIKYMVSDIWYQIYGAYCEPQSISRGRRMVSGSMVVLCQGPTFTFGLGGSDRT